MSRHSLLQAFVAWLLMLAPIASNSHAQDSALGANVDDIIAQALRLNPDISAAALQAEAALARAQGAGTFPDPTFRIQLKDVDRARGSVEPTRLNRIDYSIEQEFTVWGKRDLARSIAMSNAEQTVAARNQVALELVAAVKTAFADYYEASEAGRITEEIKERLDLTADVVQRRYEQGLGSQHDAILAKVEVATLQTDLLKHGANVRRAASRLNALLNRNVDDPLAFPQSLPAVPDAAAISVTSLYARLEAANPTLKAQAAAVSASSSAQALAKKSWYPDIAVGLSIVDQNRRWQGYEAMFSFKIPLNGTLRRAEISAATSELAAARSRREAMARRARQQLELACWNFEEAQSIATVLHEVHIPQTELAFKSADTAYQQNRADFLLLLDAQRRVLQNRLEHLTNLVNQQRALAEIEKLVGGSL